MITGDQNKIGKLSDFGYSKYDTESVLVCVDTAGPVHISSHSYSALCGPTCMVIYCGCVLCAGS